MVLDKVKKLYYTRQVKKRQEDVNQKYADEGLTDEVLDEQIEINVLKNKYDIVLDDEIIYEDYIQ